MVLFIKCEGTEPCYLLLYPLTRFPLVLKIDYDDHINREKYKVPMMTNLVNMIVTRTQRRHEAKRRVEKKTNQETPLNIKCQNQ